MSSTSAASTSRRRGAVPWLGYDLTKEEILRLHENVKTERYTHAGVGICQGTVDGHKGAAMALLLYQEEPRR